MVFKAGKTTGVVLSRWQVTAQLIIGYAQKRQKKKKKEEELAVEYKEVYRLCLDIEHLVG